METSTRSPRIRIRVPSTPAFRRSPQEPWELPLKLLLVGDFSGMPDPRPIEDRKPFGIELVNLEKAYVQCTKDEEIPWHAEPNGHETRVTLAWRRVHHMLQGIGATPNFKVELLNCSLEDLEADFEDALETAKSGLYRILHTGEYGSYGGRPFAAALFDEELGLKDIGVLRKILEVVARSQSPAIVRPHPELSTSDSLKTLRSKSIGRYLGFGSMDTIGPGIARSFERTGFAGGVGGIDPLFWVATRVANTLMVFHRMAIAQTKVPDEAEALLGEWLETMVGPVGDEMHPFRETLLRVSAPHTRGWRMPFELLLDVHGTEEIPAGPVWLDGYLEQE